MAFSAAARSGMRQRTWGWGAISISSTVTNPITTSITLTITTNIALTVTTNITRPTADLARPTARRACCYTSLCTWYVMVCYDDFMSWYAYVMVCYDLVLYGTTWYYPSSRFIMICCRSGPSLHCSVQTTPVFRSMN